MKRRDLTGQSFGRLTAERYLRSDKAHGPIWLCRCECGNEKEVPASRLLKGNTRSCGCLAKERPRRNDMTGQRFGRLVAKEFCYYNEKHQDCWRFLCDCGTEKIMPAANVKWGKSRSCGCLYKEHASSLNKQDISDQRFGRLVAVCPTEDCDATGSVIWECRCDCGKTAAYSVSALRSGRIHSCGCLYKESRSNCVTYRKDLVENTALSSLVLSKGVRSNNTSGCTGVYREKKRGMWVSYINFQKHRYSLGVYCEKEDAIKARKLAEERLHDPIVEEYLDSLTETTKEKFLEYLKGARVPQDR